MIRMDRWKAGRFSQSIAATDFAPSTSLQPNPQPHPLSLPSNRSQNCHPEFRSDVEIKDPIAARKVQKADREKLRRDRLNEQFLELGNTLDPDRPKNDKATILTDTVQILKDLSAEVNRLKAEYAVLSEESRELTQEKNELREEKASLKHDIENLNVQYQQRLRVTFPWGAIDPSVIMGPTYSYPVPMAVPPGPIPMHPSMQAFPFFGNQNSSAMPNNPRPAFVPFIPTANHLMEQPLTQYASTSNVSSKQDSKSKSTDQHRCENIERCDESNDVATELELKMPGSSQQQDLSSGGTKGKESQRKERSATNGSSSSRYSYSSSSQVIQDNSSNSVGDVPKA